MKITKASSVDIELIQKIAHESWKSNYEGILSTQQIDYMLDTMYSNKELENQFSNENYCYYLIWNNSFCVGFAGVEYHYDTKTTKLHRLYFLKEHKGKGFGKFTIDFVKKESKLYGDQKIILAVNKNNQAKEFYIKQGFNVYKEGVFDIGNGFVMDDFLMELQLS